MKEQEQFLAKSGYRIAIFLVVIGLFSSLSPFLLKGVLGNPELYRKVVEPFYGDTYYERQLITDAEVVEGVSGIGQLEEVPIQDVSHRLLGAVFMIIGLTQFSKRYRQKHPKWHRYLGRVFLVLALLIGIGGILFGIQRPFSGFPETVGVVFIGLMIIFSSVKGYQAARKKQFVIHKLWMVRVYGMALVVASLRFWFLVYNVALPSLSDIDVFTAATWTAILTHVIAIEYYIGLARPRLPKPRPKVVKASIGGVKNRVD